MYLCLCFHTGVVAIFVGSNGERDVSYYWMIGSSAVLLPFPLFATITIRFLVDFLILLGLEEVAKKKGSDEGTEMVELPDGDDDDSEDKFVEAEFYNYYIRIVRSDKFNPLSIGAAIFTFIAFVFFILALVGCELCSCIFILMYVRMYVCIIYSTYVCMCV